MSQTDESIVQPGWREPSSLSCNSPHCIETSSGSSQMEEEAARKCSHRSHRATLSSPSPRPRPQHPPSAPVESRLRDSGCGGKEQAGPPVHEDAHGNADVNVAAAGRSGDGGSGSGGRGWRWCQCGRAGWPALSLCSDFFKSTDVFTKRTHATHGHKHLLEGFS